MKAPKAIFAAWFIAGLFVPALAGAYPNGTPMYVTDTGPYCASCHSAVKAVYMPELPPEAADKETAEMKHYGLVRAPSPLSPYFELTPEQKDNVIKTAKFIDSNSSVTVEAPAKAKAGAEIKVVVRAKGGNGPVVGIMLVDRALRFQARPVSADGWVIAGEPVVKGQDDKAQNTWAEKRIKGLKRNLNFVLAFGEKFDEAKKILPSAEVVYTLKAPSEKGVYTVTAAFLYGTENVGNAGFFQRPSGRILFSDEHKIEVE